MTEFVSDILQKITRRQEDPLLTTLMNGRNLKPGQNVDKFQVWKKLNNCLNGQDSQTVRRLERHLPETLKMTKPAKDIIDFMNLDFMTIAIVASYLDTSVSIMDKSQIFQVKEEKNFIELDISLGGSVAWHDGGEKTYVNLYNQSELIGMRLANMSHFPLKEIVSHPVLDKYDLVVEKSEGMGSTIIMELLNESVPLFSIQKTVS